MTDRPASAALRPACTCMCGAAGFASCPVHKSLDFERWERHVMERDFLASQPTTNEEATS